MGARDQKRISESLADHATSQFQRWETEPYFRTQSVRFEQIDKNSPYSVRRRAESAPQVKVTYLTGAGEPMRRRQQDIRRFPRRQQVSGERLVESQSVHEDKMESSLLEPLKQRFLIAVPHSNSMPGYTGLNPRIRLGR